MLYTHRDRLCQHPSRPLSSRSKTETTRTSSSSPPTRCSHVETPQRQPPSHLLVASRKARKSLHTCAFVSGIKLSLNTHTQHLYPIPTSNTHTQYPYPYPHPHLHLHPSHPSTEPVTARRESQAWRRCHRHTLCDPTARDTQSNWLKCLDE